MSRVLRIRKDPNYVDGFECQILVYEEYLSLFYSRFFLNCSNFWCKGFFKSLDLKYRYNILYGKFLGGRRIRICVGKISGPDVGRPKHFN